MPTGPGGGGGGGCFFSQLDNAAHRWFQDRGPWVAATRSTLPLHCSHCDKVFNVVWFVELVTMLLCVIVLFSPELCIPLHFLPGSRFEFSPLQRSLRYS